MDTRLPIKITGTQYRIEALVGGTRYPDGRKPTYRWRIYERDGDRDRGWEEERP